MRNLQTPPPSRVTHGHASLRCLCLATLVLTASSVLTFPSTDGGDADTRARASLRAAIRDDGYDGPLILRRDDAVNLPLPYEDREQLIFFEVTEGGPVTDPNGVTMIRLVDHPHKWTALVNAITNRVYRLIGFTGGNDFSVLVDRKSSKIDKAQATRLGEVFGRLAYAEFAQPVHNDFEIRRFLEDEFYRVLEPNEVRKTVNGFLGARRDEIREALRQVRVQVAESDYFVDLLVAKARRPLTIDPRVEIRRLSIKVSETGRVSLEADREVAVARTIQDDEEQN